ncbi:MAG: DUF4332 domain-containing protein [Luteolibacter sp.]
MIPLSGISGIGETSGKLLEAVGYQDAEALSRADAVKLFAELEKANRKLKIALRAPTFQQLNQWIEEARREILLSESSLPLETINHEEKPEVRVMLAEAPLAIPLPGKHFVEAGVAVSDIPPAMFLNRFPENLEFRTGREKEEEEVHEEDSPASLSVKPAAVSETPFSQSGQVGIDVSRLRSTAEVTGRQSKRASSSSDGSRLKKAPLDETNRGVSPDSRRYIRGVLVDERLTLRLLAIFTILVHVLLWCSVISVGLLMLSDGKPASFGWVPKGLLGFPFSLLFFGTAYLFFAPRCGCQICRQKFFWPRHCIKNPKAHHIKGLGYILPLCLHLLIFRWFRCTYCGTPLRLKE